MGVIFGLCPGLNVFLQCRSQVVHLDGVFSSRCDVLSGVR